MRCEVNKVQSGIIISSPFLILSRAHSMNSFGGCFDCLRCGGNHLRLLFLMLVRFCRCGWHCACWWSTRIFHNSMCLLVYCHIIAFVSFFLTLLNLTHERNDFRVHCSPTLDTFLFFPVLCSSHFLKRGQIKIHTLYVDRSRIPLRIDPEPHEVRVGVK